MRYMTENKFPELFSGHVILFFTGFIRGSMVFLQD